MIRGEPEKRLFGVQVEPQSSLAALPEEWLPVAQADLGAVLLL